MGHRGGYPEALLTILSSHTTLFWVVEVSFKNVVAWISFSLAVAAKILPLQMNMTSSIGKGVLSFLDPVYSLRQRMKKYATIIMSHSSMSTGFSNAVATLKMC